MISSTAKRGGKDETTPKTLSGSETAFSSKKVMLRGERHDTISLQDIHKKFQNRTIPAEFTIVQRTQTYCGPELLLDSGEINFLLTAPAPDRPLLLWGRPTIPVEQDVRWNRLAEVEVRLEQTPAYEFCEQCGNPMRTMRHERLSNIGKCPNQGR